MNKVYKGRQRLNLEQASGYYKHAYKIGVDHGRFDERERLLQKLKDSGEMMFSYELVKSIIEGSKK